MEIDTLRDEARDLLDETVALRRTLHRFPEIGNDLPVTRENVLEALDGLPLDVTLLDAGGGVLDQVLKSADGSLVR
jgi:hippurate hydrolase